MTFRELEVFPSEAGRCAVEADSSIAGRGRLARQIIRRRIKPADAVRLRQRTASCEEAVQKDDRVSQVDSAVIVCVGCLHARGLLAAREEMQEKEHGIGEIDTAVAVHLAADER